MTTIFAFCHHILAFGLVAVLCIEACLLTLQFNEVIMRQIRRADLAYGIIAGLLLAVGLCRVFLFEKGWEYYYESQYFWLKMAAFAIVGGLSVIPTIEFAKWRRRPVQDASAISERSLRMVRSIIWAELLGVVVILLAAAAMARDGFY